MKKIAPGHCASSAKASSQWAICGAEVDAQAPNAKMRQAAQNERTLSFANALSSFGSYAFCASKSMEAGSAGALRFTQGKCTFGHRESLMWGSGWHASNPMWRNDEEQYKQ